MPKLVVSASLLAKSQVAQYTRKDGVVVQAHDNGRMAAAPKKPAATPQKHSAAEMSDGLRRIGYPNIHTNSDGRVFLGAHKDDGGGARPFFKDKAHELASHLDSNGYESKVVAGPGGKYHYVRIVGRKDGDGGKKPAVAKKPAAKKVAVSASVAKKAAPAKTGSEAPAKMVNVGSEKWPLHAKSSEKLATPHASGASHHVGGFKAPEYPAGGGATDGDVTIHHDGKTFSFSGKKGKNQKTGEDSYEFTNKDDGDRRAWVTRSGHLMND